ncbi:hypothetical protein H6G74_19370 [Nostoc spongiaeforme FACHB-130]|uniref:Uncharacterized protein n=1 Tax=Nostoc spongiaeforme FACHB-130 TaxID=1357510 RepID=A0ABR8FYH9_9NOSO|nr:hypothetical protein [Nostoc spongiaeforme]MBD2596475.1 hypothetical protein [Nostoc spongiaeforme FACHB-130]
MKLFNDLVTVAESTAPVIYVAFFSSIFSCRANLVPTNQSNNKHVQKWNFNLLKFLTNKQLTQNTTSPKHTQTSVAMKLSVGRLGSSSLAYSGEMLVRGADAKTSTTETSFSVTAVNKNC